ncbi:Elongator subunit elp4 [Blastocladiella emersonii ATCC 22665]|nr:Elongator subunit elp4 [Blastocladiella emersonii ATCC 22665]
MSSSFRRAVPAHVTSSNASTKPVSASSPAPTAPPAAAATTAPRPALPPGVKLSPHNALALLSTGVGSLDDLLGGGLPLGTLLVIEEDRATGYAQLLLQYFIAQGIQHGHHVLVASADEDPSSLVAGAPAPVDPATASRTRKGAAFEAARAAASVKEGSSGAAAGEERMKIAWRYQNLPKIESRAEPPASTAAAYCGTLDITKKLSYADLAAAAEIVHLVDLRDTPTPLADLYRSIVETVESHGFLATATPAPSAPNQRRQALRIAVHAVCSPLWPVSHTDHLRFLHQLKGLLRRSFASAVVTWSYTAPAATRPAVRAQCDFAIALDAFASSERIPASLRDNPGVTGEYTGLLAVHRLARLNALVPASAKVTSGAISIDRSLAFQVRRKRFSIETWHLPPELGDESKGTGGAACASAF